MIALDDMFEQLVHEAKQAIVLAETLQSLDHLRVTYLGKKGKLTDYLKSLGNIPPTERPRIGQYINKAKETLQELIEERLAILQSNQITQQLAAEAIDITLPGRRQAVGSIHPVTKTRQRIESLFHSLGFSVIEGPEIEDDYHNFTALNIPPFHPARASQDTFYFADETLLRTQMSTVQIRVMKTTPPPLRIIAMGRVYRRDFDITHTPMFHQIEGLMINETTDFCDLKGILTEFLKAFFEKEVPIRFRASYFPFTEPSAEVDIGCLSCESRGCRICKQTGWLEVLGCGMVHPHVLEEMGIDSERYTGWAFGAGLDRLTMLYYRISDLRSLFENDVRFLRQF